MKSKLTTTLLAFFLGGLGIHHFYLNQVGWGIGFLLLCWTGIPTIVSWGQTIYYMTLSEQEFNDEYNK